MRRFLALAVTAVVAAGVLGIGGSDPAAAAAATVLSSGCATMNQPALDGTIPGPRSRSGEFFPGEVVTLTAGPPDTVTGVAWVELYSPILVQTEYPGTVSWVVPGTLPNSFSISWGVRQEVGGSAGATWEVSCEVAQPISGVVTDRHTGEGIGGVCVGVSPFGEPQTLISEVETSASGSFEILVPSGQYQVAYVDCERWDYAAEWYGTDTEILPVTVSGGGADASMALTTGSMTGLVDMSRGLWALSQPRTDFVHEFYYGNPGDFPFVGDWNCDGVDTPGMYRQSDGYVYLRNSNTQGIADIKFFFGNPGDVPLAGDFNADGCDTVSIYRPSNQTFYIINKLGANDGGLGAADLAYVFGNPGDKPFVGDFDADGVDTVGLHRETTGLVYFRNSHTQGNADNQYIFGDPGDKLVAGNFSGFWVETPAVYRSSDRTFYIRHTNTQGNADRSELWDFTGPSWHPVAGVFGLSSDGFLSMETRNQIQRSD